LNMRTKEQVRCAQDPKDRLKPAIEGLGERKRVCWGREGKGAAGPNEGDQLLAEGGRRKSLKLIEKDDEELEVWRVCWKG